MVKQIVWTIKAKTELLQILEYWKERSGSNKFSSKLYHLIETDLSILSQYPEIGRKTNILGVRVRIIHKYLLYYEFKEDTVYILTIRHQKRDPQTLKLQ